ncbi:MAG: flagellar biosynthetic protein FliR [Legionellales bacterium]
MLVANFLKSLGQQLPLFFIVQARIAALFTSLFFLRKEYVPGRLLVGISFVLSVFIMNTSSLSHFVAITNIDPTLVHLLPTLLLQAGLGMITGLMINFFAEIFLGLGQLASMQAGLGFVNFYIPKVGSVTPLTNFYVIMATIIFFELNGHLILIKMIVDSMQVMPNPAHAFNIELMKQTLLFAKIIFSGSLMLALSMTIAILLSNFTLAFMTKFSPQLNVFSIGINISLLICYFAAYVSFDLIIEHGSSLLQEIFSAAKAMQS